MICFLVSHLISVSSFGVWLDVLVTCLLLVLAVVSVEEVSNRGTGTCHALTISLVLTHRGVHEDLVAVHSCSHRPLSLDFGLLEFLLTSEVKIIQSFGVLFSSHWLLERSFEFFLELHIVLLYVSVFGSSTRTGIFVVGRCVMQHRWSDTNVLGFTLWGSLWCLWWKCSLAGFIENRCTGNWVDVRYVSISLSLRMNFFIHISQLSERLLL
jgi:hypothetical protein